MADPRQGCLSLSESEYRQPHLAVCRRRAHLDDVRSRNALGILERLHAQGELVSSSCLLHLTLARDAVLGRLAFLRNSPTNSLATAVQICSFSPSQQHQSRAVLRPRDASRGASAVLFERAPLPDRAVELASFSCTASSESAGSSSDTCRV